MATSAAKSKEPTSKEPLIGLRVLIIVAIGVWIYAPVLLGDWIWDDNLLVSENIQLRSWSGLGQLWFSAPMSDYWPLSWSVLWIEWHLWGNHPLGYHRVSLAFHLFSGFLIWRLLERLGWREGWLGGLLFIVHPLAVESVAWISEIKNTLSLPFFLLASHAYLDGEENKNSRGYLRSIGYYLAAMLSKTSTVMFPIVLLLYAWSKSRKITARDLKKIVPYLLVALPLSLVTVYLQNHDRLSRAFQPDSFFARVATAGMAVLFYLAKFLWPANLLPIYPRWVAENGLPFSMVALALLGLLIVGLWAWRGKEARCVGFGFGFFLLNLLPVLGFLRMKYQGVSWVADHFAYLPMIGLIGLVVAAWQPIQEQSAPAFRPLAFGLFAVIMALLAFASRSYAALFVDRENLWTYTLQLNPEAAPAHNDLSIIAADQGRFPEALAHAREVVKLYPDLEKGHRVLGQFFFKNGQVAEAEEQFRIALQLDPDNADAHDNLASILAQSGRYPDAMEQFNLSLKVQPDSAVALAGRGELRRCMDDPQGALIDLDRALALDPDSSQALLSRAVLRQARGDATDALDDLRRFRELAPDDPNTDYALLWIWIIRTQQGQKSFADQELSDALNTGWNANAGDLVSEDAKFLLGEIDEGRFFASPPLADKNRGPGRLCEAWYYVGVKRLLAGNKAGAADAFHSSVATRRTDFFEYTLAQGELNMLGSR
jgi:tetratricopeptide (TPR) repeat protein